VSLRRRLALTMAGAVAAALVLAALVAYVVTRSELRGQVDERLREQVAMIPPAGGPPGGPGPGGSGPGGPGAPTYEVPLANDPDFGPPFALRIEEPDGDVLIEEGDLDEIESPHGNGGELKFEDAESDGDHVRVLSASQPGGGTVILARSLEGVDDALGTLRAFLLLVVLGGVALAALAARTIAGRVLVPVERLTDAAEHVSATEDLSRRIEIDGEDEVAQLGSRFNAMLERLETSREELDSAHEEQRRLIADASHELRTPVTSLRTNIEVIASGKLSEAEEKKVLAAATAQAEELGALIGDLMDLARGEPALLEFEEIRLDQVVAESVERARRNSLGVSFELDSEPSVISGVPERIARAVNNLLDNAAQHGGGTPVEVEVGGGAISVRDHGPGVPPDELEHVFDRFYRGHDARRRLGSGLGLAIVRQIAEAHGGTVSASSAPGGGARFEVRFVPVEAGTAE
jgi:two-component system, OmpR family, sensor histidine kinase MprB